MATATEFDDFEGLPTAGLQPSEGSVLKTTAVDTKERRRVDDDRVQQRKCEILLGGGVLFTIILLLGIFTFKIFLQNEPRRDIESTLHAYPSINDSEDYPSINYSEVSLRINGTDMTYGLFDEFPQDLEETTPIDEDAPYHAAIPFFCGTQKCRDAVRFLEDQLDPDHDPCANLYDHVCSRWQQRHKSFVHEGGSYSVDDRIVEEYKSTLVGLLLDKAHASPELRAFFEDCVDGHLVDESDVGDILANITQMGQESGPDGVAGVIARMAALGISPFFDVIVNVIDDAAHVRLQPRSFYEHRPDRNMYNSSAETDRSPTHFLKDEEAESVFMESLGRHLCVQIQRMVRPGKTCILSPHSSVTLPYDYRWYESTGLKLLSETAASILKPLLGSEQKLGTTFEENERTTSSSLDKKIARMGACLRIIDQYAAPSVASLSLHGAPRGFEQAARKTLRALKTSMGEIFPEATSISIALVSMPASKEVTPPAAGYKRQLYASGSAGGDSELKRLLQAATWMRWTGLHNRQFTALSTVSSFEESSSTLYVPLPVFNMTMSQDQWLQSLSLGRIGPRTLKTLFLGHLSTALNDSRWLRCVLNLSSIRQRSRDSVAERTAGIDIEELVSFYVSLLAYRRQVGEAMDISGSLLNSDSLFLLYYVFNNCEIDSAGRNQEISGWSPGSGRRRVDTIAAVFTGTLLERCQKPLNDVECDI